MNGAPGRLAPRQRTELGDYPVDAAWSGDGKTLLVAGGEGRLLLLAPDASGLRAGEDEDVFHSMDSVINQSAGWWQARLGRSCS